MLNLTKRQKDILQFIKEFIDHHDYAPSFREIADHFNLQSVATIADHIESLKQKGCLESTQNMARSLQLTPAWDNRKFEVPLLGIIAAGEPIEAIRTNETIEIPKDMMGNNVFALKVRGDSMIDDGIYDGDYVIIEQCPNPSDGDIVVALIDNQNATLKRFYRRKKYILLKPANARHRPIKSRRVTVQGKVKGVIRKFR